MLITGCRTKDFNLHYSDTGEIVGLASPVTLNPGPTKIIAGDYFNDVSMIDSVNWDNNSKLELSENNEILTVYPGQDMPPVTVINFWIESTPYSIPVKKSKKIKIDFKFDPSGKKYHTVQIAGEINGWNPKKNKLQLKDNIWQTELLLDPGTYQYKLVLDGKWVLDPHNPDSIDNNIGGYNSLLVVGEQASEKKPLLFTEDFHNNEIKLRYKNNIEDFIILWENFSLPENFADTKDNETIIHIPEDAKELQRSFIRIWAWNENGISNDKLIPLKYGKVINDPSELTRHDYHASIIYNVFVDRFYNANPESDKPVDNPEIRPKANYMGGDIRGITQKIKDGYFNDLGVNTIWISPVVKNPEGAYGLWPEPRSKFSGYHGYWPISFTKVDYRFGTSEDLKNLVETAHDHGLNVLLDFVANHVHELHPVYQAHPDWATNLYLPDGSLNTEKWDEHRLTTWFDTFLPTLDLTKPEVYEMLSDSAVYWIKKYNFDGFRHDATKHIPEIFWRTLTKKLKEQVMIPENKILFQIGETYGSPELIGSYVNSGELDAQFDFNVYDDALAVFAGKGQSFERLNSSVEESLEYYGDHNLMGYITGNQDKPRFISLAGGEVSFDEDYKLAGWTRDIGVGDPVGYKKRSMHTAFIMTIPGIPVIYYGDEFGMPGANDPDNRRMMRFENLSEKEKKTKDITEKLLQLRNNNIELIYGNFEPVLVRDEVYVYSRTYFDKIGIAIFNNSDNEQTINFTIPERFKNTKLKTNFNGELKQNKNNITVVLEPFCFEILTD